MHRMKQLKRVTALIIFLFLSVAASVAILRVRASTVGTVAALDAQHVVVQTTEGKTLSILLNKATKYRKGEVTATGADLKVGDRVLVEATGEGDMFTASEIRFASPDEEKGHAGMHPHTTAP